MLVKESGTPPAAAVSAESDQYFVWAEMMRKAGCKVEDGVEQVSVRFVAKLLASFHFCGLALLEMSMFLCFDNALDILL